MKKKILYAFFILLIIASGIFYYYETTKEVEQPEIYDPTPSEISVDENEKIVKVVESLSIKMAPDVDLAAERKKNNNNDIIGRLEIPDLFNVLVVKTNNNSFYLNHAVNKSYDIRGSEFLDYRVGPTSKQVIIYGHNTRDPNIKVAFLKLEKFLDATFFNNNPYIIFQHDGGKSIYKIVAMKEVKEEANAEHLMIGHTGQAFVDHLKKMTSGSGIIHTRNVAIDENSEVLVLQTCSHRGSKNLFTIVAVKIDY